MEYIDLKEETATDSAIGDIAKETYCINWPMVSKHLHALAERIKSSWLKWLAKQGLMIFDALHQQTCRAK